MQDEELIKLINEDRNEGLKLLIRQYSGLVYTIIYSKISSVCTKEDAEECAADVFVEFYRNISSFDSSKGSVKAFLSIIAKRIAMRRFHVLTKDKPELVSIDDEDNPVAELRAEESDNELPFILHNAVKSLGEPDSIIIIKKFFGGETAKQIASELGMNEFAVHRRIERALKKLKKILMEVGYNEQEKN